MRYETHRNAPLASIANKIERLDAGGLWMPTCKWMKSVWKVADEIEPDELRRLLYYLIDTVLDRQSSERDVVLIENTLTPTR